MTPQSFDLQLSTTFGRGVKVVRTVFEVISRPKVTSTIWTFLFQKKISGSNFVFKKVRFWRSCEFPSVIGTSVVKSYCPNCLYFWGDFLGEGVNDSICVQTLDLAPKMTCDQIFAGQFLFSRNWRFGGARQV